MKYFFFQIYHNDSYLLEVDKVDRYKYVTCDICNMILNKRISYEIIAGIYYVDEVEVLNILKNDSSTISDITDGFDILKKKVKKQIIL